MVCKISFHSFLVIRKLRIVAPFSPHYINRFNDQYFYFAVIQANSAGDFQSQLQKAIDNDAIALETYAEYIKSSEKTPEARNDIWNKVFCLPYLIAVILFMCLDCPEVFT